MENDLVTIDEISNEHEALMAKMYLEKEGIFVFLKDFNIVATDWLLSNAVGNIKLQVPAPDAKRSMALLAEVKPQFTLGTTTDPNAPDDLACFSCGTEMTEEQDACPACGWSYGDDNADDNDAPTEKIDEL